VLERERRERLAGGLHVDWVGFMLIGLAFGCLEWVLDRGQEDDWFSSHVIVYFATVAAAAFIFFIIWELTEEDPIVDIRLLGHRQFGMAFVVMLSIGGILFGSTQIMPQLLQTNFPYTAELSGLAIMPGGLAMLVMMPIAGQASALMQPKYWIAIGLGAIAVSMWYSTSLVPDASFGFFATIRVYQMVGLPFLFIPINTIAYDGLPQNKTNQASALMNVARNLGGSIGISMANTQLLQRSQFHQARLVENLVPSSSAFQTSMKQMTQFFAQQGSPPTAAQSHAYGYIGQMVSSQASLMAYIDIFHTWSILALFLIPVVLLLIRRVSSGGRATAMH
jgi:MFS transporter, DHA2 family, multidrug resistance protein